MDGVRLLCAPHNSVSMRIAHSTVTQAALLRSCQGYRLSHIMHVCVCAGGRKVTSTAAFAAMRTAVLAAQQQVLNAAGTLTTLVGAVVCRKRWGGGHVLLAVGIGDSPCYVWRAASGTVEEVTYMPPFHGFHRCTCCGHLHSLTCCMIGRYSRKPGTDEMQYVTWT
jgi:hypothetical protein